MSNSTGAAPGGRPVTLFTGQWADLPVQALADKVAAWGFDGLELATWADSQGLPKLEHTKISSEDQLEDRWSVRSALILDDRTDEAPFLVDALEVRARLRASSRSS